MAGDRAINLFTETIEQGPRSGKVIMRGIPGLQTYKPVGTPPPGNGPIRGLWSNETVLYTVTGGEVWQVFNDDTPNLFIGPIDADPHPAIIVSNGFQLAFASAGKAFIAPGGGFGVIPIVDTNGDPILAQSIAFMDQYIIAALVGTKQIRISNLAPAGATWDPGDASFKEAYSDDIVRVWVDQPGGEYLWLFGEETTEVWTDTGGLFPFQRIQSMVWSIGCDSTWSVAGVQGWRFWLWRGSIYGCAGFQPVRVSDYGVEQAIRSYSRADQTSAEAFCWVVGGHVFYAISFKDASRTWVYDVTMKQWHERLFYFNGQYSRYRPRVYAKAFGKDVVGDYANNTLYTMDQNVYTDACCNPLRRERITPYITQGMNNLRFNQLRLDMDTGVGLDVPVGAPGYDPQVIMRYSKDRGKRWSNERQQSMGREGQTDTRVIFPQLGSSRIGMVFDVVVTDPVPVSFNGAYVDVSASTWPRP